MIVLVKKLVIRFGLEEIENMRRKPMNNIRKMLNQMFPYTKEKLLPTIYIDEDIEDTTFNYQFEKKFYENNLWPKKRKNINTYF